MLAPTERLRFWQSRGDPPKPNLTPLDTDRKLRVKSVDGKGPRPAGAWWTCTVLKVDRQLITVHYDNHDDKYNELIDRGSARLEQLDPTHPGEPKKLQAAGRDFVLFFAAITAFQMAYAVFESMSGTTAGAAGVAAGAVGKGVGKLIETCAGGAQLWQTHDQHQAAHAQNEDLNEKALRGAEKQHIENLMHEQVRGSTHCIATRTNGGLGVLSVTIWRSQPTTIGRRRKKLTVTCGSRRTITSRRFSPRHRCCLE